MTGCRFLLFLVLLAGSVTAWSQTATLRGKITTAEGPVGFATVHLAHTGLGDATDSEGAYYITDIPAGSYQVAVSAVGFEKISRSVTLAAGETKTLNFTLQTGQSQMDEVVVSGTLKEVMRSESPVPVEVYTPAFFRKNPSPNIYDALQHVNGVRPQLNCNVCNTGDIHINGLEGPYTMVLIDGMPIVSGLSTVYGLSGIPNALVQRVEVVKGPASSLYGSEAVGGLINIITKSPKGAPLLSADAFATSWGEYNLDLGFKLEAGKKISVLTGVNYFNYKNIVDKNGDNFTDLTLQDRVSIFQKWSLDRKDNRIFQIAGRYVYEDRWGGELNWQPVFRGSDSVYGESIYTSRWELLGQYQLPVKEKMLFSFSFNEHSQNSAYGQTFYLALQRVGFGQLTWDKETGRHSLLAGAALRYTEYTDNTPATGAGDPSRLGNRPDVTWLPGLFVQDELKLAPRHRLLLGFRYDYNNYHGHIYTPRLAYKWALNDRNVLRLNAGTGFRVVNLFTEDHAALTGARSVDVKHELKPEQSYNVNLNYGKKVYTGNGGFIGLDATAFYTYFTNRIVPDYETDPHKIIYDNLTGHAVSTGVSLNVDVAMPNGLKILAGGTYMENPITKDGVTAQQMLTEKFSGTWAVSYQFNKLHLGVDYTGNVYGPMRLPLLGPLDPRSANSPWWSIQNIQLTYAGFKNIALYGGVKNLLDWTPARHAPFLIARAHDPFDKQVSYDSEGQVIATPGNPYALFFDPNYVYASNQGIRFFFGIRYELKK